jgi:MoxR-like ATPase
MYVSAEAMNEALTDFASLQYPTQIVSAYEAFLTAKWIEARGLELGFNEVNRAVAALFQLVPGDGLGRLSPFRYDWKTSDNSGRKTVWNNNTRGGTKKSATLFVNNDIRNGLMPNAASLLEAMLPTDPGGNPVKPKRQALAVLVLRDHEFPENATWSDADQLLRQRLTLTETDLSAVASPAPLGVPLLGEPQWSFATLTPTLAPQQAVTVTAPTDTRPLSPSEPEEVTVVVDSRVERMLRLALAAYSSILLVGPPGTGKGTLLKWLTAEAEREPEKYGFDPSSFHPNPLWRTPDESWTAFDLIGGLAPNNSGILSWAPGALLDAIATARWLILDETNRADMDKIMGPLLTWLSRQEVELGTTEVDGGASVHLGWSNDHASGIAPGTSTMRRYLAGRDWRLLGTYNPQDAQRVFRFGQALSRRFIIVPIPALKSGQFLQLLSSRHPDLPEPTAEAIGGLYSAHQADSNTALGPAVFLNMAQYVLAGQDTAAQPFEDELLAEAYVLSLGRYLAAYDSTVFKDLGYRVVDDEGALTSEQWSWIQNQRDVLS